MEQQALTQLPMDASRAVVFTDARGRVVFVDSNFFKLMNRSDGGATVVGTPMHELLGIERNAAQDLLQEIGRNGMLSQRPIELRSSSGAAVHVSCSGVATYDDQRSFIGADLALIPAPTPAVEPVAPPQVEVAEEPAIAADTSILLQDYFLAHMHSLRELVARIGGNRLRQTYNTIVNDTATRNEWPITIQKDKFYVEVHHDDVEIYQGLLAKAVVYAVSVIGPNVVVREAGKVDQQLDAQTMEAGRSLGLSDFFANLK